MSFFNNSTHFFLFFFFSLIEYILYIYIQQQFELWPTMWMLVLLLISSKCFALMTPRHLKPSGELRERHKDFEGDFIPFLLFLPYHLIALLMGNKIYQKLIQNALSYNIHIYIIIAYMYKWQFTKWINGFVEYSLLFSRKKNIYDFTSFKS